MDQKLLSMDHLACSHWKAGHEQEAQRIATRMIQMATDRALGYLRMSRCLLDKNDVEAVLRVGCKRVRSSERGMLIVDKPVLVNYTLLSLPDLALQLIFDHLAMKQNWLLSCKRLSRMQSNGARSQITVITGITQSDELRIPSHVRHLCLYQINVPSVRLPRQLRSLTCDGCINFTSLPDSLDQLIIIPSDYQPLQSIQSWAIQRWREGKLKLLGWWQLGLEPTNLKRLRSIPHCLLTERIKIERLVSKIKRSL